VQDGKRVAIACEDEGAQVTMVRKVARSFAIVVHHDLPGFESVVSANVCIHARVAAQGKFGRVAVLADDVKGMAIFVLCVGIDDEAARKSATDGALEVGWDCFALANGSDRPKEILELTGVVLVS
jgi:hypothetical protein